ncbi:MAG: pyruvate dehydrogenase (acetyl-transferring) E1 component subunit alpha [Robiginitomaculum sp.]|nr:MAG: pyruvate dehydrogenase (acetyl-transferring) E1 component subunit alpha [Robiginitomaculum sp.]
MATPQKTIKKTIKKTSKKELLHLYREMLFIRRFEEKAGQLYGMGLIAGFCHLYIGQEAVVTGVKAAIKDGDQMITSYRDHGHMLALGMSARGVMAELTGRSGGYSKGKGGSMHMFSVEKNFYGGHGIVAAQVPIGAGLGLANKYLDNGKISAVFFGDGAANQGQVYEALNMAQLWKLPTLFIIENNQYAMGTSISRSTAQKDLYKRGLSFGVKGVQVDGMDVLAVRDATKKAAAHARSGKGPMILEMMTYRYRGHSMSDPAKYRTREEVSEMREEHDPIDMAKNRLLREKWADLDALKAIDKDIKAIVADAVEFAKASPEPDPSELYTDVLLEADA